LVKALLSVGGRAFDSYIVHLMCFANWCICKHMTSNS